MLLDFTEVIEKRGFDPARARLVRHDRRAVDEYRRGPAYFGHFVTYQGAKLDPFAGAELAFQFLPGPTLSDGDVTALFVGAHRIGETWFYGDGSRLAPLHCERSQYVRAPRDRAYDIQPLSAFDDLRERILIRWGRPSAARAWSQWAAANRKEVIELRQTAREPSFPGFAAFTTTLDALPALPGIWRSALESVKGIYLLVCPRTGSQYVGSAYGEEGFYSRWMSYFSDGHGGNKLLRDHLRHHGRVDYSITILEIASPDMAPVEIISREHMWKKKLGSRAHGLNAN